LRGDNPLASHYRSLSGGLAKGLLMPLCDFSPNEERTRERWTRLQDLYKEWGICPTPHFHCELFESCRAAFCRENPNIGDIPSDALGCASHLGERYDLTDKLTGSPMRVAVVGIDHGLDANDIGHRRKIITSLRRGQLNQHMAGVARILQALLREHSENFDVFNSFAMPNALKCAGGQWTWNRPAEMLTNCAGHLVRELAILEPNIIVTQSHDLCFVPLKMALRAKVGTDVFELLGTHRYSDWYLLRYDWGGAQVTVRQCYIVDSPHPRYRSGFYTYFLPHFRDVLVPQIRQRLGLTAFFNAMKNICAGTADSRSTRFMCTSLSSVIYLPPNPLKRTAHSRRH
jgi:hypothetical protein